MLNNSQLLYLIVPYYYLIRKKNKINIYKMAITYNFILDLKIYIKKNIAINNINNMFFEIDVVFDNTIKTLIKAIIYQ